MNILHHFSSMGSKFLLFYLFLFFSMRFVSGILDLVEILACNQLQNGTNTTGRVIGFAKRWLYSYSRILTATFSLSSILSVSQHGIKFVSSRTFLDSFRTRRVNNIHCCQNNHSLYRLKVFARVFPF